MHDDMGSLIFFIRNHGAQQLSVLKVYLISNFDLEKDSFDLLGVLSSTKLSLHVRLLLLVAGNMMQTALALSRVPENNNAIFIIAGSLARLGSG